MAVQATPYVVTALSHSAELFRRTLQMGLPLGSAGGVVPATPAASANLTAGVAGCNDLVVFAPASGMSVNVNPGQCIVPGSLGVASTWGMGTGYGYPTITLNGGSKPTIASTAAATTISLTTQGAYYCYNDGNGGATNLTVASANPTNPRIDVVGAQVSDSQYSGSANNWALTVVTGTAASSPAVPAFPANFLPLALVWVPANATSIVAADIIDLRIAYNRNPFNAKMYRGAAWTPGGTGWQRMPYDTIVTDISGSCTTGASAQYVAPVTGSYFVTVHVLASANTARNTCGIWKGGSTVYQGVDITYASTAEVPGVAISGMVQASVNEAIIGYSYQTVATALQVVAGDQWINNFSVSFVGAL